MSYNYTPSLFMRTRERRPPTTPIAPPPSQRCMQDIMYRWARAETHRMLGALVAGAGYELAPEELP